MLFHVHDNLGVRRGATSTRPGIDPLELDLHLPPGRGSLPWGRIAPLLREHDAPLVLEVEPSQRPALPALTDGRCARSPGPPSARRPET